MTEIQNSKQCLDPARFGHWILEFEIYLEFGACNLKFFSFG